MRHRWVYGPVLAMLACQLGGRVDRFAPARQPQGVATTFWVQRGAPQQGELLAVQDTALVVLVHDTVTLVPYRVLKAGRFAHVGDLTEIPPAEGFAGRLRLISRFPQGLTPELLARLLAAYGQSALKVVAS